MIKLSENRCIHQNYVIPNKFKILNYLVEYQINQDLIYQQHVNSPIVDDGVGLEGSLYNVTSVEGSYDFVVLEYQNEWFRLI